LAFFGGWFVFLALFGCFAISFGLIFICSGRTFWDVFYLLLDVINVMGGGFGFDDGPIDM